MNNEEFFGEMSRTKRELVVVQEMVGGVSEGGSMGGSEGPSEGQELVTAVAGLSAQLVDRIVDARE